MRVRVRAAERGLGRVLSGLRGLLGVDFLLVVDVVLVGDLEGGMHGERSAVDWTSGRVAETGRGEQVDGSPAES